MFSVVLKHNVNRGLYIVSLLTSLFCFCCFKAGAGEVGLISDSTSEKKVDFLEQIYFSGENKEGLNVKILVALQTMQSMSPTPLLAKQVTFLAEIKDRAVTAKNSCDILDMLSAGIYNLDAAEAAAQGVKAPSAKAQASTADAVSSLNKLSSAAGTMSNTATTLAWSNYLLGGSHAAGLFSGANKIAGVSGTLSGVTSLAGTGAEVGKALSGFLKKDKPCGDASKKDIAIGNHSIQMTASSSGTAFATGAASNAVNTDAPLTTTVITITKITSPALRALKDSLQGRTGVKSVEKNFYETQPSTVTVVHTGSTDSLSDWIEDKFGSRLKLLSAGNGKINLAVK